jgi:addiction module RelE/StbE family toxin
VKVRWTGPALRDLEAIADFLSETNPDRALDTARLIFEKGQSLRQHPLRGRRAPKKRPWRELFLAPLPYVVAYEVREAEVVILRVWHMSQDRYRVSRKKRD